MFHRTPFFLPWLYPTLMWRVTSTEKNLYLTLDDGPVPGPTELALEILKKYNTKATFFCIGDNVQKHPHILNRIIGGGHTIGNHTFNHLNGWSTGLGQYIKNVEDCNDAIKNVAQSPTLGARLFRPPNGRITRAQINALKKYSIVMWDVITYDYSERITPESCLKNSIRASRPGSIVVFHDSLKAEKNMLYVLPRYIEHFLDNGYSFKTLT